MTWHQCAAPDNSSVIPQHLQHVDWNSENVTYNKCEIIASKDNHIDTYPCLFGHTYDYRKELSFRTEVMFGGGGVVRSGDGKWVVNWQSVYVYIR